MPEEMAQSPALRTEYLVSGMRTPPARRNSKLATLGRIFKPWKWRKKKGDKLKHSPAGLEKKSGTKQNRDEIIRKGLIEIVDKDPDPNENPPEDNLTEDSNDLPSPTSQAPSPDEALQEILSSAYFSSMDEDQQEEEEAGKVQMTLEEELKDSVEKTLQALMLTESLESPPPERNTTILNSPPLLQMPQPKASTWLHHQCTPGAEMEDISSPPASIIKTLASIGSSHISGHTNLFQPSGQKISENNGPVMKGQNPTPTGSPLLPAMHMPLPPSRVIEELHRALATKHRQDSFHSREVRSSPKKRVEFRTSRSSSIDKSRDSSTESDCEYKCSSVKEAEENKENLIRDSSHKDNVLLYEDEDELNSLVISGTLPRKYKKELLAVKLRNRPSKQELEDRNIFPQRTEEERQKIREQIEIKLSRRLSQRPAVEELERRNILKQRNDQTEQEERREIKQRLTRKLNQRPTVDELRERKILIRFSDYVEVAKAQDYDRRADKPWTRLSAADKAAIRKELNEYKSNEMEVHASSKHLTRYHRP
ncbi:PREDICTED: phosphatase and actin regulator 3 isoform X2 [Nanorana parkeri]|uniref:phosphatase and actin regulator 3 isoform X2 n=1 Tax=Nanorana parkeri TaxID=125878 RepID=UPI000853F285|nr:PREDICTED: phosphatase and actin regulator 3 isoform X2 [Nanorana parkeri]